MHKQSYIFDDDDDDIGVNKPSSLTQLNNMQKEISWLLNEGIPGNAFEWKKKTTHLTYP